MTKRTSKLGGWVIGLWAVNAACILAAGAALVLFWDQTPFAAAAAPLPTAAVLPDLPTVAPTFTVRPPTLTATPSPTRKPTITPYVYITDTPTPPPWMQGPLVIGYSVSGRPLELYRFGDGPTGRMIVAGIHGGNEWNTIALADELIAHLRDHPEAVPENVTLYILRALNPDGEARAHDATGRTNDHGVDLNRNFPANWKATWDDDGCWTILPVTAGAYPGSEPETVALMLFIQQHKINAIISYHSAALGIFPGGIPPDKYSVRLAETLADVSNYPYPPLDTGCEYTGNLADWASSKNIAAVDLELTNHRDTDFAQNLKVLEAFLNWKR
jgi:predicted deacylase